MKIINKSKKTIIANSCLIYRSAFSKAKGLMFTSRKFVEKNSLIFEFSKPAKTGLHMLFVFYPIDVLFIDEKNRVVDLKENFRPFTFLKSLKKSKYIIELPIFSIKLSKTKTGDVLQWH